MTAEPSLTPTDVRLLGALARTANVVRAAGDLGIGRDRAVYRLRRLARLYGGPVATARRGGRLGGTTRLSPLGRRLLAQATGVHPGANRWTGIYHAGPPAVVDLGEGIRLAVAFRAPEGRRVTVEVDPEAWVLARHPAALSARIALRGRVESVRRRSRGTVHVTVRWGPRRVRAAITEESVRRLGIVRDRRVILYAKAVAVRRVLTLGSPRS